MRPLARIALIAVLSLFMPIAAHAQDAEDVNGMGTTTPGAHLGAPQIQKPSIDCAAKNECLLLVNNNPGYVVTAFFINDGHRDHAGKRIWSDNLFFPDFKLPLHKAFWIHRSTDLGCVIWARVDMRAETDQRAGWESFVARFDTCVDKSGVTIIKVDPLAAKDATPTESPSAAH
jgi:hypothetical protein